MILAGEGVLGFIGLSGRRRGVNERGFRGRPIARPAVMTDGIIRDENEKLKPGETYSEWNYKRASRPGRRGDFPERLLRFQEFIDHQRAAPGLGSLGAADQLKPVPDGFPDILGLERHHRTAVGQIEVAEQAA